MLYAAARTHQWATPITSGSVPVAPPARHVDELGAGWFWQQSFSRATLTGSSGAKRQQAIIFDRLMSPASPGGPTGHGLDHGRVMRLYGHKVQEVHRPPRKGERRLSGKSDTIDAEHAARQVLAGLATAVPKTADGAIEALRVLKIARDTAVKARTTAMITLKATLVTSDELRAELEPLTDCMISRLGRV